MNALRALHARFLERLQDMHHSQNGAVALLCLAAILILFMLALVLYDTSIAANEKVHTQISADASAYSQASIRARTLNMIGFANVGKRFLIGVATGYSLVIEWMQFIVAIAAVITVICWVLAVISFGGLTQLCKTITMITLGAGCVMIKEEIDYRGNFEGGAAEKTWGRELRAFDNYQRYFKDVTPYWGWTEVALRALINHAPIGIGWPLPRKDNGIGGNAATDYHLYLPVEPTPNHKWDELCARSDQRDRVLLFVDFLVKNGIGAANANSSDTGLDTGGDGQGPIGSGDITNDQSGNLGGSTPGLGTDCNSSDPVNQDVPVETCDDAGNCTTTTETQSFNCGELPDGVEDNMSGAIEEAANEFDCNDLGSEAKIGVYASVFLAGLMAHTGVGFPEFITDAIDELPSAWDVECEQMIDNHFSDFKDEGTPFRLMQMDNIDWLMHSSNMAITFRPNANAKRAENVQRYGYLSPQYTLEDSLLTTATLGTWSMARAEVTYKPEDGESPNVWSPRWGARLRPIALPDEWNNYSRNGFEGGPDMIGELYPEMLQMYALINAMAALPGFEAMNVNSIFNDFDAGSIAEGAFAVWRAFDGMHKDSMRGIAR